MSRLDPHVATVSERARRPLARALQAVAVLGAVISLAAAVVGWRVVGALDDVAVESTEVTADALIALEQTLELAADLVGSVDDTLVALEDGLDTTAGSLATGAEALTSVSQLAEDAAPALASATATLRRLEGVGTSIDQALQGLSSLPLAPDYDPDQAFGAAVGDLADDLEPLGDSFAATADDLRAVVASTDELESDLAALTEAVGAATTQLADSDRLIEDYRAAANRAGAVAEQASTDLGADLALLRALLVLGGLVFALGQAVPWLLARALLVDPPGPDVLDRPAT